MSILRAVRLAFLLLVLLAVMNKWVIFGLDQRGLWVVAFVVYIVTYVIEFRLRRTTRQ